MKIFVCNLIKPDQTEQLGPHRLLMMNMVDFVERVCGYWARVNVEGTVHMVDMVNKLDMSNLMTVEYG